MIIIQKILQFLELFGYFDLTFDSSRVSLAYRYTITATVDQNSDITDAKIIGYSFPGQQEYITYLDNNITTVTGSANASVNSSIIRVYVSWDDNENTQSLTDAQDTVIAKTAGNAIIHANVLVEQLVN